MFMQAHCAKANNFLPAKIVHEYRRPKVHAILRLPASEANSGLFSVTRIVNQIATQQYPCDGTCFCDQNTPNVSSKEFPPYNTPHCQATKSARISETQYLMGAIYDDVQSSEYQLVDSEFSGVSLCPPIHSIDDPWFPSYFFPWPRDANFTREALETFSERTGVKIIFECATNNLLSSRSKLKEEPASSVLEEQETPGLTESSVLKTERFDALAAEIDPILHADPLLTPGKLMHILRSKIGAPGSCIVEDTGDGVKWEEYKRTDLRLLTVNTLRGRIGRWRRKYWALYQAARRGMDKPGQG